ncbi:MAG: OmpA family protein [Saprospiraceae bacterium]|nr:OmpA family protein [Saprospiraceae bacterium]
MTIRIKFFYLLLVLVSGSLMAQDNNTLKTSIPDEVTVNADQNKNWRMGQSSYSAKPKNSWELGVHLGHLFIDGDIDSKIPGGYGVGLHLRKAVHYVFSVRADFMYGQSKGIDPQGWTTPNFGGGLVEKGSTGGFQGYVPYEGLSDGWNPSYKTTQGYLALQGVINIGNLLFHKDRNKWNWYTAIGVGLSSHKANLDLLDASGKAYTGLSAIRGTNDKFNTKAGRKEIISDLEAKYDGDYETPGFKKAGIFRLGDETNVHVVFTASMGVSRKLSKRINLGLEHQVITSDNDYLDGIHFRTALDQSNNNDISHYTNLRLGINLGNFDKVTEPLYWLNPLDAQMNDIAALKQRPVFDLTDSDQDGIIDMLDQEMETPAGAPVDTRGIALDSDGDGLADYKDKEPYSPPGYVVSKEGVADVKCCINMEDVNKAIDVKAGSFAAKSDCGKWFLPMIHFDLDRSNIKPEFYGHLHHVASVMKMCPDLCITVQGHTDVRSSNNYNNSLSYSRAENVVNHLVSQYGVDRNRIKIMYGGEDTPMVAPSKREKEHYMNRRVEIRVCGPNDNEMSKPESTSSSSKSVKSTNSSKFIGNKNSGF